MLALFAVGLTAEAAITLDAVNCEIELSAGTFDLDLIWDSAVVTNQHLVNGTDGTWLLNWSIVVETDAALIIDPVTGNTSAQHCTWLKMNDTNLSGKYEAHIDVQGHLFVNDTMITGWNGTISGGSNSTNWSRFRPYIYILPVDIGDTPWASFLNSTIGYLGFDMDNRYGIVYEDNTISSADVDSQGWMHNCTVLENYIGINFQGCENMNVTNTWFNNTKDAGIVYTLGGVTTNGAHGGFVGDHPSWTHRALYAGVAVDDSIGSANAMAIRLCYSDNITFNNVLCYNASTDGLSIQRCDNLTANNTISHHNTNAADDYNIYIYDSGNCTFANSTAYDPDGAADGSNWGLVGAGTIGSNYNNFTSCSAWGATAQTDFHIWKSHNNNFIRCSANDSAIGFYIEYGHNNTCINCTANDHVLYNYKIYGSQYNIIDHGYANTSAIGVIIFDEYDTAISYNNTVLNLQINTETSYAISIGTDGAADNICHNNTVFNVTVTGTTTGDGIFLFDNVTYNHILNSTVTGLTTATSGGMGATNHAINNTFDNCSVYSNGGIGYYLLGNTSYNRFYICNSSNNLYGMLTTEYANNNTVVYGDFNNNTWAGIWVTADAASNGGNTFWYSTSHDNFYGMYIQNTPQVRFTEVNAYNNSCYGVIVADNASAYFFNCIVDNPTVTWYDWAVSTNSNASIYSPYILGFDRNVNYQFDTVYPYGLCQHDVGDGLWGLNTTQMTVHCNDAKTAYVNLTTWTSYVQWVTNADAGTYVYAKIGGLTPGISYDLIVSGDVKGTYTAQSGTMLATQGTTGYVWFNYTGPWTARLFTVRPHVSEGGGGAGGDGDGDDTTPTTPDTTEPLIITGEDVIVWIALGILAVFGFLAAYLTYVKDLSVFIGSIIAILLNVIIIIIGFAVASVIVIIIGIVCMALQILIIRPDL